MIKTQDVLLDFLFSVKSQLSVAVANCGVNC